MPTNAKGFPLKAQGEREGDLSMPQRKTINALGIANGTPEQNYINNYLHLDKINKTYIVLLDNITQMLYNKIK